jgi:hypothetical protein
MPRRRLPISYRSRHAAIVPRKAEVQAELLLVQARAR